MRCTIATGLACILLALSLAGAVRAGVFDRGQPYTLCYATDGTEVETFLFNAGSTDFAAYPVGIEATVEDLGDVTVVRHEVVLRRLTEHAFLPVVAR